MTRRRKTARKPDALKLYKEAVAQQAATAEILRVISRSPANLRPVFDAILKSALRLCDAHLGLLNLAEGDKLRTFAQRGGSREFVKWAFGRGPYLPDGGAKQALAERRPYDVADARESLSYRERRPNTTRFVELGRVRSFLVVPLLKDGKAIGNLGIYRRELRPFTPKQISLVSTFASQAVIAIANARLFNETKEALERQIATSEVLRVISSSPTNMQPVFESILENAIVLCDAQFGLLNLYHEGKQRTVAQRGGNKKFAKWVFERGEFVPPPGSANARIMADGKPVHIEDYSKMELYRSGNRHAVPLVDLGGFRTYLAVPLLKDGKATGSIAIYRSEVRPFTQKQIDLVSTFANQAVIAIENVRLFNETKEALEHQAASGAILRSISGSMADPQPVFDAIVESLRRLFATPHAVVALIEGGNFRAKAIAGNARFIGRVRATYPWPVDRPGMLASEAIRTGEVVQLCPIIGNPRAPAKSAELAKALGYEAILIAPLLRQGKAIGYLVANREEPVPFDHKEVALIKSFAAQAVIAIENARLFNETKEALERQTATSEVLKTISRSTFDLNAVLQVLIENATRLAGAKQGFIFRFDGKIARLAYSYNAPPAYRALIEQMPFTPGRGSLVGRVLLEGHPVHIPDVLADHEFSMRDAQRAGGFRSMLGVPMMREGKLIGVIAMWTTEVRPFTEKQIELVSTFADQAVIAIENVRLFNETTEALEQQKASADVLGAISGSIADTKPVFDKILQSCQRLFAGKQVGINLVDKDGQIRMGAYQGPGREELERIAPFPPGEGSGSGAAIAQRRVMHYPDVQNGEDVPVTTQRGCKAIGVKAAIFAPMLWEGRGIGVIFVGRDYAGSFTEKEVALLKTFADQAAIAIENVRLFNETKEALERQTATAEILKVISSSPTHVQPVFDTILENALRLCGAHLGMLALCDSDKYEFVAQRGASAEFAKWIFRGPVALDPKSIIGRLFAGRQPIHVPDMRETTGYREGVERAVKLVELGEVRSFVAVPMLKEGHVVGAIVIYRREVLPFTEKQVDLVRTFADQAVIAIENVRLFNETKEALDQQTASSEILRVITGSPTDVQPVLDAVAENAARLCGANDVIIRRVDGDAMRLAAHFGSVPVVADAPPISRGTVGGRALRECRTIHVHDIVEAHARGEYPEALSLQQGAGYRTMLAAPLVREGAAIGVILVRRMEMSPFSDKQIKLLETFADQAVIAIENVRLFNETKEALERQTATADILKVISSSPTDTQPVFDAIVQSAARLFQPRTAGIVLRKADQLVLGGTGVAGPLASGADIGRLRALFPLPYDPKRFMAARAIAECRVIELEDAQGPGAPPVAAEIARSIGYRSLTVVPLVREGVGFGIIVLTHPEPGFKLTPKQLELVKTFADQAVIAIENVRLFREIEDKSAQLEVASRHKSDFLAGMSHELRTPLNAILGFNEMILGQVYGEVPADMQEPLADIQASGKHLLRLINNVLDLAKIEAGRMELALQDYSVHDTVESVRSTLRPLAAEKGLEFVAMLPADLPLAYGDSGRITQCLINLAGNSLKFTKAGKVEISVETKGDLLVYKVADTGIGIAPDKLETVFAEFKQTDATIASEYGGTGLGLSISRKFIEMHGGRIWVESELGKGSAFIFEVPIRVTAT